MNITREGSYQVATQSVSHFVTFELQNWAKTDRLGCSRTPNRWIFLVPDGWGHFISIDNNNNNNSTFNMINEWFSSYIWMSPRTICTRFIHRVRPHILPLSNSRTEQTSIGLDVPVERRIVPTHLQPVEIFVQVSFWGAIFEFLPSPQDLSSCETPRARPSTPLSSPREATGDPRSQLGTENPPPPLPSPRAPPKLAHLACGTFSHLVLLVPPLWLPKIGCCSHSIAATAALRRALQKILLKFTGYYLQPKDESVTCKIHPSELNSVKVQHYPKPSKQV